MQKLNTVYMHIDSNFIENNEKVQLLLKQGYRLILYYRDNEEYHAFIFGKEVEDEEELLKIDTPQEYDYKTHVNFSNWSNKEINDYVCVDVWDSRC